MIKKLEGQIAWELLKCEAIKMFLDNGGKAVRDEEIYNLVEIRGFGDEEFKKILDTPIRNMTVRGIEKTREAGVSFEPTFGLLQGDHCR